MTPTWRTSSFCSFGGCVHVAPAPGGDVLVARDIEGGPRLRFDADEWAAFLAGVKAGEFDGAAAGEGS